MEKLVIKFRGQLDYRSIVDHKLRQKAAAETPILIDLDEVEFALPCGLAALAAWIDRSLAEKCDIAISALDSRAFTYMQNMNLFGLFGVYSKETFNRHEATGRFARMSRIDFNCDSSGIAKQLIAAMGVDRSGPAYNDLLTCLDESLTNTWSHAGTCGYCLAQSFKRNTPECRYEIAMADGGRGILDSLSENKAYSLESDREAIECACREGTSREARAGVGSEQQHFGMGLYQIDRIAESVNARFYLCSGGWIRVRKGTFVSWRKCKPWQGTIVSLSLNQSGIDACHDVMRQRGQRSLRYG